MAMSQEAISQQATQIFDMTPPIIPATPERAHARIISIAGPELKFEIRRDCQDVVIGRGIECQIVVKDARVSGKHARIRLDEQHHVYYIESLGSNATWVNQHCLHKGHTRALQHGDEFSICMHPRSVKYPPFAAYIFQIAGKPHVDNSLRLPIPKRVEPMGAVPTPQVPSTRTTVTEAWVQENWDLRTVLGSGGFSEVRLGVRVKESTPSEVDQDGVRRGASTFAVKVIDKTKFTAFQRGRKSALTLQSEARMLMDLNHPGIVQYHEWFETETRLFIIMELLGGGDLLDAIMQHGCFDEDAARRLFREVCEAVAYLHSRDVVHRDLKPENLMLTTRPTQGDLGMDNETHLKIVDFGLAKSASNSNELRTFCGTPQYFAPEIISSYRDRETGQDALSGYGKQVDVWSLGVILYIMLSGVQPFDDDEGGSLYRLILEGKFEFDVPEWTVVSQEAKELVQQLLTVNPRERLTIQQALDHPWLRQSKEPPRSTKTNGGGTIRKDVVVLEIPGSPERTEQSIKRRRTLEA